MPHCTLAGSGWAAMDGSGLGGADSPSHTGASVSVRKARGRSPSLKGLPADTLPTLASLASMQVQESRYPNPEVSA